MWFRLAALFLLPAALFAQDGSFTLAGTVVNSATGEPMARALVTINGFRVLVQQNPGPKRPETIQRSMLTDAGGAFRFTALPEARYTVRARKPGFQPDGGGLPNTAIDLKASTESMKLTLAPLGVITGKVIDQYDRPMRGVTVHALVSEVSDGTRQIRNVRNANTDDRGVYRMWNIPSGRYYMKVGGQSGSLYLQAEGRPDIGDSFLPTYPEGPTITSATPVEIGNATKTATADFHLKLEPAWEIRGNLRGFNSAENIIWSLVVSGEEVSAGADRFNRQTGVFAVTDVVNGSYVLRAKQTDRSGEVVVTVKDRDTEPVNLTLYPTVDVPVNIRFTNMPPKPDPSEEFHGRGSGCTVSLHTESLTGFGTSQIRRVQDEHLQKVFAGSYGTEFQCADAYVQSALAGTQDLMTDHILRLMPGAQPPSIEILATYGGGMIEARLDDKVRQQAINLLLVPQATRSTGPVFLQNVDAEDGVTLWNLAPGGYVLYTFAKDDLEYRNPAFLQKLTGGQPIQIEDGKKQDVTIHEVIR